MILSDFIWFNSNIKVGNKPVNFIGKLFSDNGNMKPWKDRNIKFHLKNTHKIFWL